MILGAHMSIAGGISLACERGRSVGCDAIQIFTKNERQWKAKELTKEDVDRFIAARKEHGILAAFAHDSYLINMASPDDVVWRKSVDAFVEEMERSNALKLDFLVTHPGSPGEAGEAFGIRRMSEALDEVGRRTKGFVTKVLLETTAGQGRTLGFRFEQIAAMIDGVGAPYRREIGVCFDTCHVFAAGYDISTARGYRQTMKEFNETIGLDRLRAFHVNDSKKPLGSRVDRHENIGMGCIGKEAFRCLMNDDRFKSVPMVIETPKEDDMDPVNLKLLRSLAKNQ